MSQASYQAAPSCDVEWGRDSHPKVQRLLVLTFIAFLDYSHHPNGGAAENRTLVLQTALRRYSAIDTISAPYKVTLAGSGLALLTSQ